MGQNEHLNGGRKELPNALLTFRVSPPALEALERNFQKVVYCPPPSGGEDGGSTVEDHISRIKEQLPVTQVLLTTARTLALLPPPAAEHAARELRLIQLGSAGVDVALNTGWMKRLVAGKGIGGRSSRLVSNAREWVDSMQRWKEEDGEHPIAFTNASGIHVRSISQYCVATLLSLYHALDQQIVWARVKRTWADEDEFASSKGKEYGVRTVFGKTVGMLGYGHIGRETARLLKPFQVDIIAATSSGVAKPDTGYILPGTGDKNGTIPSAYYRTTERDSFHAFLQRSDVLICSVPSTSATRGLLSTEEFGMLPKGAVVINVGRGDLIDTDALLQALENSVSGAALDVTSPEPLPPNHPLFSHKRCIVTPHSSGTVEGEMDEVVNLCLSSVERMRRGEAPWGIVDIEKGY